jgi:hypothetical protein
MQTFGEALERPARVSRGLHRTGSAKLWSDSAARPNCERSCACEGERPDRRGPSGRTWPDSTQRPAAHLPTMSVSRLEWRSDLAIYDTLAMESLSASEKLEAFSGDTLWTSHRLAFVRAFIHSRAAWPRQPERLSAIGRHQDELSLVRFHAMTRVRTSSGRWQYRTNCRFCSTVIETLWACPGRWSGASGRRACGER